MANLGLTPEPAHFTVAHSFSQRDAVKKGEKQHHRHTHICVAVNATKDLEAKHPAVSSPRGRTAEWVGFGACIFFLYISIVLLAIGFFFFLQ